MSDKDTYTVERSATMQVDPQRAFDQVVDFRNWPAWSPWEDIDPAMQRKVSGAPSGVGAVYEWSGNRKAGEGRMEITEASSPSKIAIDLRFVKPFKSRNTTTFTFQPEGAGTRVTWHMVGPKTFGTKVMGLFTSMDKLVGKDFEKGLARLSAVVETPAA